jgi:uncharacterized protein YkwD
MNQQVLIANTIKANSHTSCVLSAISERLNKLRFIAAGLLFLVVILFPPINHFASAPRASAVSEGQIVARSDVETYYLNAINSLRVNLQLKALTIDNRLNTSAYQKGLDMSQKNYFSHWAPDGKSFSDFIWQDSPKANAVAENLAHCYTSRQLAFDALVASPTHYAIMVGQYDNMGVSEVLNKKSGCIETVFHFSRYN